MQRPISLTSGKPHESLRLIGLALLVLVACTKPEETLNEESELSGGRGSITEAFTNSFRKGGSSPTVRPDADVGTLLRGFRQSMRSIGARTSCRGGKTAFKIALFGALKEAPALPSDQVFRVIRSTLDEEDACGGTSCARVFGINKKDINPLMDEIAQGIRESQTLTESSNRPMREKLLASLQRKNLESILNRAKFRLTRDGKNPSSLEGTCAVPALQAFGLRSLGSYPSFLSRLQGSKNNIDYRNNMPKPSQLSTGACHLFATVELFKHARSPGLSAAKNIDIPYTFAEIWALKLGLNADDAINKELKFLESLESAQLRYMQDIQIQDGGSSKTREELFKRAVTASSLHMRFEGQGNNPLRDFQYLASNGAIHAGHSLPPVSMEQIETLGENLALARLRVVEKTVLMEKSMSVAEKRALVEGPIKQLFAIAERSRKATRDAVKRELGAFKLEIRGLAVAHDPQLEQRFFSDLRAYGPIHINVNSHSTVVVGYDARKKVFFIRDSDDPLNRPYTELPQDELVAQLKAYYIMLPKP